MPPKQYKSSARIFDTDSELDGTDDDDDISLASLPLNQGSVTQEDKDAEAVAKPLTPPNTVQRKKKRKADEKGESVTVSRIFVTAR